MTSTAATSAPWPPRPRVVLLGAGDRPHVVEHAARVLPELAKQCEIVLEDFESKHDLSQIDADFAIVFGGDGSILRAARQMGLNQRPILGVNLGKLGFLAGIGPEELLPVLPAVCRGECRVVEHLMFHCCVTRGDETIADQLGLNETAVLAGAPFSMLNVQLFVDGELATTYSCDGLIISTPVGSTAHSLSAGGPILRKTLPAFVICPVSPHTLTVRPVVDSSDHIFEISVAEPNAGTTVVVDGRVLCSLGPNDRVRVCRATPQFRLIEVAGQTYYRTLRDKLGWAGNLRGR